MKPVIQQLGQFGSVLASTPRWSHWLLPLALLLFAIYLVLRKWPSMRGLIARRREELNALGEPPPEKKWRGLNAHWRDISAGGERKIIAAVVLSMAMISLVGGTYSVGHHMGYRSGFMQGQWELLHDRYTYTDVLIVERHNDQEFRLQPARMRPFEVVTCEPVDWQKGQMMAVLTYQQRKGCKSVALSGAYEFYSYQGKRMNFKKEISNDD